MSQCRHGKQQDRCAECLQLLMPAHEAIKALVSSGVDPFAPAPDSVDDYMLQLRDERDRYREGLMKILTLNHDGGVYSGWKEIAANALGLLPD